VVAGVRANRAFLRRAVRFLAEQGIAQFLDVGSGLPTGDNLHEVAGRVNPEVRCVYVDNDPIVLVHARALLADNDRTIVVEGDIREPGVILAHPDLRAHLDFTRPVAVIMAAILHFVGDEQDPAGIVRTFAQEMAPASALVISHVVEDGDAVGAATRKGAAIYTETTAPFILRTREQVAAWFEGFRLVPPGLVDADAPAAGPPPTPTAATAPTAAPVQEPVRGPVLALRVPADDRAPVGLVRVAASAAAFSDAIGGGYLDDTLDGMVDGHSYVVLLDEHRVPKGLPGNQRAAVLAARLGHVNRAWLADLRGDVLIVGLGPGGTDEDVPGGVIEAAARSGLLGEYGEPDGNRAR
jgi:SAM-dependent methyltransferase